MANLPATGDITALASNAAAQVAFEALRDWLSQLPAGPEVQLTISAGTITPATRDQGSIKVETEAAAATDDLANIAQTNIQNGSELLLRAYDASHTVVVKHAAGGAGQILLQYDADFSLDDTDKWLRLKRVGTDWIETHRCWGNDPLAQRQALGFKATADIASAATVDLSAATGNVTRITGTTAVSAWTMNAGQWHMIIADGALPLTYHATTNKLNTGGSNYTCVAGDRVLLHKDNSGIIQATIFADNGWSVTAGKIAQSLTTTTANYVGLSTQIPLDNTIPQNTEGTEILTRAITPKNASSTIRVTARMSITAPAGSGGTFIAALFKDTGADAIAADRVYCGAGGIAQHIVVSYEESAGSTAARTYKLRGGPSSAITMYYNGNDSSRLLGGVSIVSLNVQEILP